ncbi:MAG: hypothetical protein GXP27_08945 [Planctomycetes bacterium]|nr:hypothetical protein [Planctomycetota bacterium]
MAIGRNMRVYLHMYFSIRRNCRSAGFAGMCYWWIGVALLAGCGTGQLVVVEDFDRYRPVVPLDRFLQVAAGMTNEEVNVLLGTSGQHEFLYLDEQGEKWLLKSYEVTPDSDYKYVFYLLFRAGRLFALIDGRDVTAHFRAARGGRPAPLPPERRAFDDDWMIREMLRVQAFWGDAIASSKEILRRRVVQAQENYRHVVSGKRSNPVWPAFLFVDVAPEDLKREYELNEKDRKQFDPMKISIGMSEQDVERVFGPPRYREELNDSHTVCLYGPKRPKAVAPEVAASPVMVLFHNGRVVRVLSHGFFNIWWREKIWPGE